MLPEPEIDKIIRKQQRMSLANYKLQNDVRIELQNSLQAKAAINSFIVCIQTCKEEMKFPNSHNRFNILLIQMRTNRNSSNTIKQQKNLDVRRGCSKDKSPKI